MYLRWTRIIFFQITLALCIATVGLSSWGLAVGTDKKKLTKHNLPGATLHIGDALGVGGAVTAAAGVAALVCLAFDLFMFLHRRPTETIRTVRLKEGAFAFACAVWLAVLIPATVVNATRSGYVTKPGASPQVIAGIVALSGEDLRYRTQRAILSYTIVGWFAFLSTVINLILVSIAARHTLKHGQPRLDSESHDVNSPALSQAGNNLLPSNSLHNTSAEKRHAASPGLGMDGRQVKMEL